MGWLNISPDINEHYLNIWLDNHSVLSKQLGHIWSVTTGTYNHDLIDLIQNWTFLHHLDEFRARCPDASSHDPWSKITSIWTLFLVKINSQIFPVIAVTDWSPVQVYPTSHLPQLGSAPALKQVSRGMDGRLQLPLLVFHVETFGQMNSSHLVPSHRSIHVSLASFCSATSVCKRVNEPTSRHQTIAANEREERHLLLAATLPLSSGHFMHTGQSKWWWCRYSLSLTINI